MQNITHFSNQVLEEQEFVQGFPVISQYVAQHSFKQTKPRSLPFSAYPGVSSHRHTTIQLIPPLLPHRPPLPLVPYPPLKSETSSPNRDATAVHQHEDGVPLNMKHMQTPVSNSSRWPPHAAFSVSDSATDPKLRADVSHLLMHNIQTDKQQGDMTRQLNYLIHWTAFMERNLDSIQVQLNAITANLDALKLHNKSSSPPKSTIIKAHETNLQAAADFHKQKLDSATKAIPMFKKPKAESSHSSPPQSPRMNTFQNKFASHQYSNNIIQLGIGIPILNLDDTKASLIPKIIFIWCQRTVMAQQAKHWDNL